MILQQIPHQPDTVGVVTKVPAVFIENECVNSARAFGMLTAYGRQCPCLFLEGYRDIQALAAVLQKVGNGSAEAIFLNQDRFVAELLVCLPCKQRVDTWRLAVGNGVAHDGIAIHQCAVLAGPGLFRLPAP